MKSIEVQSMTQGMIFLVQNQHPLWLIAFLILTRAAPLPTHHRFIFAGQLKWHF
jgi:hypothetical protein